MTTKPDFNMIQDLQEIYTPKARGIVTHEEGELIKEKLELGQRTVIELNNIRNTVVMVYGQMADATKTSNVNKTMMLMDSMSAITAIIDGELINRGAEV